MLTYNQEESTSYQVFFNPSLSLCMFVLRYIMFCRYVFPTGMIIYGLMYFICIPSGYLLLTIYSLVNMNIVTWGTRESK